MDKKRLAFGGACGALLLLAVLSSMFSDMLCLSATAGFLTLCALKLRRRIAKYNPIAGDAAALIMLAVGYGAVFYLIKGFGHDIEGMARAVWDDIVGLKNFPIRGQAVNTLQRMADESLKVKRCLFSAVRTRKVREAFTVTGNVEEGFAAIKWSWHYLILGVTASCIVLYRMVRCGLSVLSALAEALSERKKSNEVQASAAS